MNRQELLDTLTQVISAAENTSGVDAVSAFDVYEALADASIHAGLAAGMDFDTFLVNTFGIAFSHPWPEGVPEGGVLRIEPHVRVIPRAQTADSEQAKHDEVFRKLLGDTEL